MYFYRFLFFYINIYNNGSFIDLYVIIITMIMMLGYLITDNPNN